MLFTHVNNVRMLPSVSFVTHVHSEPRLLTVLVLAFWKVVVKNALCVVLKRQGKKASMRAGHVGGREEGNPIHFWAEALRSS